VAPNTGLVFFLLKEAICDVWMLIICCAFIYNIFFLRKSFTTFTLSILGNAVLRHQATKGGDTSDADHEGWQKRQYSTDGFSKSRSKSSYFRAFGVDLSPDNVAVAIVYFVQGVLGLSRLAVSFYLKDDLHLDPAEV
jgi:hypothetical protein